MSRQVSRSRLAIGGVLITNNDFENTPTFVAATNTSNVFIDGTAAGNTTNWQGWGTSVVTPGAQAQFDTSVFRTGSASMKLSTLDATGIITVLSSRNSAFAAAQGVGYYKVLPNTSYTLRGYAKCNNAAAGGIGVYIGALEYNAAGTLGVQNNTLPIGASTVANWTLLSKTFTTASTAQYVLIALRCVNAGNVSDVWFDDISLTQNGVSRISAI